MLLKIIKHIFSYLLWPFIVLNCLWPNIVLANEPCLTNIEILAKVTEWGRIAKVVDGDTIHLKDGRKIRLIGINTPEIGRQGKPSQPFARQAQKVLNQLLERNKKIGLAYDQDKKDRYKRLLAYVSLEDGRSIEQILLARGLAHSIVVPPNDSRINCYRAIEKQAHDTKLGIWRLPENQWVDAHKLPSHSKGYRFVYGTISDYSESRKSIYLKLSSKLSIRIAKKDKPYFSNRQFKRLVGKPVKLRGWVSTYSGRQSIHIRTEHDLEL
ncbi:MAG: thermonuclease family protein [gamma proteobacterium symbiont of Bathyaustriella thionipta]|nr:thermonuclease family protein [gamma proteobacterium symbiont of Bathyaustriella thionipta]MCU7951215.1 thermonuclease family protein [gamma proteobacterium symbiont of Bathyaustriella thionipta]MCU7952809.1 thermonuclease family protein [gamma proteobacterium symbiont of Bathyaustriella thionipta]MCU7957734.1 thermonuclease family protein [gamma proteobacterium symbiont of Bathyaustriella thionipta]MCU7967376.1 thermonuclease family protein [gamma proteobacterium symbiont of Bathyaustriella